MEKRNARNQRDAVNDLQGSWVCGFVGSRVREFVSLGRGVVGSWGRRGRRVVKYEFVGSWDGSR